MNDVYKNLAELYLLGMVTNKLDVLQNVLAPDSTIIYLQQKKLTPLQEAAQIAPFMKQELNLSTLSEKTANQLNKKVPDEFIQSIPEIFEMNEMDGMQGVMSLKATHCVYNVGSVPSKDTKHYLHLLMMTFHDYGCDAEDVRIAHVDHMVLSQK